MTDDQLQVISVVVMLVAIAVILVAGNLGDTNQGWRISAYILMVSLAVIVGLLALSNIALALVPSAAATSALKSAGVSQGQWLLGWSLAVLGCVAAGLALLPPLRRGVARLVPSFRGDSAINAIGLSMYVLVLSFFISTQISSDQLKALSQGGQSPSVVFIIATNQLPFLVAAVIGVGFLTRRNLGQTMARLGLYWPGWGWAIGSVGVAVALVIFGSAFDILMSHLTPEQSKNIQQVSDQLLKNVNSLAPAIAIALAAGIGEEVLFRGALLPRLGNPAAALLFAILHAQYAISLATLEIFILGLILGVLRRRAGTTAAIIAHSGYDMILLAITLLAVH